VALGAGTDEEFLEFARPVIAKEKQNEARIHGGKAGIKI
jgi:hypothetical protein